MRIHLLLLCLHLCRVSLFVLDGTTCPSGCSCYSSNVQCSYKHLTSIPSIPGDVLRTSSQLKFDHNDIGIIPALAFGNLSVSNVRMLQIYLNDNQIHSIHKAAFEGLGSIEVFLDLSNNKLNHMSVAFSAIHFLQSLNLLGNDIFFMDTTLPQAIGSTLESFQVGMRKFAIWQSEISDLTMLRNLEVDQMQFTNIPDTAFEQLRNLRELTISNSLLYYVPDAICKISQLSTLSFTGNKNLNTRSHSILPTVCPSMYSVTKLTLDNNSLEEVPHNLFTVFYSLFTLSMQFNNLSDMAPTLIRPGFNHTLRSLDLSHNMFQDIPALLTHFPSLSSLTMAYNHISSIGYETLAMLTHLSQIDLNYNPIIYVDPHAFYSGHVLNRLVLTNTNLTTIPAAVLHMADRSRIYLSNSPVVCSCDSIGFMMMVPPNRIQNNHLNIDGYCTNASMSLRSFILTVVPDCF